MRHFTRPLAALLLCATTASNADATVRYISTAGNDMANTCTVPMTPCRTIENGLGQAAAGDTLLLAGGTYKEGNTVTDFGSIQIYGGFNEAFSIQSADTPTIIQAKGERALGFLFTGTTTGSVVLTDLTIRKSFFDEPDFIQSYGGGVFLGAQDAAVVSLNLNEVVFEGNRAPFGGGLGVFALDTADITSIVVSNCRFSKNKADRGGAIAIESGSTAMPQLQVVDSVIEKNSAYTQGGGISVYAGNAPPAMEYVITQRSQYLKNKTKNYGGAIAVLVQGGYLSPQIQSSVFLKNKASISGGAIATMAAPGAANELGRIETYSTGNTFTANKAHDGGGIGVYAIHNGAFDNSRNDHTSHHDIIRGNKDLDSIVMADTGSLATLTREYGIHGTSEAINATLTNTSVLDVDPLFVEAGKDIHLAAGSPAIDAVACVNNVSFDFEGDSRPQGAMCDIGADEVAP